MSACAVQSHVTYRIPIKLQLTGKSRLIFNYARETSYYAHENSYYARTTKIENPVLLGVKTQKIVHFSFLKHNTL